MTFTPAADPTPAPEGLPAPAPPAKPPEDHRLEMFIFFCLGALMPLASAIFSFATNDSREDFSTGDRAVSFFYYVAVTVPGLYLLHRTREGWAHFGVVRPVARRDVPSGVVLGLLLFGFMLAFWTLVLRLLPSYMLIELAQRPKGAHAPEDFPGILVFICSNAANGISEELFMRSYFLTRIKDQTGSWLKAVLYSSALFASYHIYHGVLPMISIFFLGLVFGFAFVLLRRLWPLAIAHMVLDILIYYLPLQ